MLKNCLPTFMKIQTFSQNTDQIQANFQNFQKKVLQTKIIFTDLIVNSFKHKLIPLVLGRISFVS